METDKDTIEVMGKQFLKCQQEDCQWNIGWLGGHDCIEGPGKGTRICNLGASAIIEADAVPPSNCHQPYAVLDMARAELHF